MNAPADELVEAYAAAYDAIFPGAGDILRDCWRDIRPEIMFGQQRAVADLCGAAHEFDYYR